MQVQQRDEGMAPPTPNGPTSDSGGECIRPHHHTVISVTISPPIPQRAQCNRASSGLCPDLCRTEFIPTNVLSPSPTSGPHIGDTRPGRSCRAAPPPYTSIIGRTRKRTAVSDAGPGLIGDGKRLYIQRRSRITAGPRGPCVDHHSGIP